MSGMVPKIKRYGPGRYKMHSGEETVAILRAPHLGGWLAQPSRTGERLVFRTKQDASEWAYDWLTEHA